MVSALAQIHAYLRADRLSASDLTELCSARSSAALRPSRRSLFSGETAGPSVALTAIRLCISRSPPLRLIFLSAFALRSPASTHRLASRIFSLLSYLQSCRTSLPTVVVSHSTSRICTHALQPHLRTFIHLSARANREFSSTSTRRPTLLLIIYNPIPLSSLLPLRRSPRTHDYHLLPHQPLPLMLAPSNLHPHPHFPLPHYLSISLNYIILQLFHPLTPTTILHPNSTSTSPHLLLSFHISPASYPLFPSSNLSTYHKSHTPHPPPSSHLSSPT